jgi:hypothetical protein
LLPALELPDYTASTLVLVESTVITVGFAIRTIAMGKVLLKSFLG